MMKIPNRLIFCKDSQFLQDYIITLLMQDGLSKQSVFVYDKSQKFQKFLEDVYTLPMFGTISVGFIKYEKEFEIQPFEEIIDTIPSHARLVYLMDKIPLRLTKKLKEGVYFRDSFSEEESKEYLLKLLLTLNKKVSTSALVFLQEKMIQDPSETILVLSKLASFTPHLYIDEQVIKNSFDVSLDTFKIPELFFKAKGLEASRILDKTEFPAFKTLFLNYILLLIRFKIAEKKTFSEKMRIIKSSPETIRRLEDTVKPFTLRSLEARFLFYSSWLEKGKDIFLIKFLTTRF